METGQLYDPEKEVPGELSEDLPTSSKGKIGNLVWPIVTLFVGVVGAMFWTGYTAIDGEFTLLAIFENTDPSASLFYGGMFALVVSFIFLFRQVSNGGVSGNVIGKGIGAGAKSMLPAIYILILRFYLLLSLLLQVSRHLLQELHGELLDYYFQLPVKLLRRLILAYSYLH
jgi:Na+/H+ antiporter NhaC